jgi:glucokinase
MKQIVAADIGGTHARFAIARIDRGKVMGVGEPVVLKTGEFVSFERAWNAFERRVGSKLPSDLSLAVAAPVAGNEFSLTNSHWQFRRDQIASQLKLNSILVINDFAAVGHAVAAVDETQFLHIAGPNEPVPLAGVITIVGPGTGLGAALLVRDDKQAYQVIETEGGHLDFAPLDSLEDSIVAELRKKFGRVSAERIVSGPGLLNIYEVLAKLDDRNDIARDEKAIWSSALDRTDQLSAIALDRFCMCLGAVAGDLALAHGASAVVIAGGIGRRLGDRLAGSGFGGRFVAKGRFERRLAATPVKVITYPEPGLLGAAVAFARQSSDGDS